MSPGCRWLSHCSSAPSKYSVCWPSSWAGQAESGAGWAASISTQSVFSSSACSLSRGPAPCWFGATGASRRSGRCKPSLELSRWPSPLTRNDDRRFSSGQRCGACCLQAACAITSFTQIRASDLRYRSTPDSKGKARCHSYPSYRKCSPPQRTTFNPSVCDFKQNTTAVITTTGLIPSALDAVSTLTAMQFAAHAHAYQAVSAQSAAVHEMFVTMLAAGAEGVCHHRGRQRGCNWIRGLAMDFAKLPPEVNSGLMYPGPGSGPIIAATASWDSLAAEVSSAAGDYGSVISDLTSGPLCGPASASMVAAAAPYLSWTNATAAQAEQAEQASQSRGQCL